MSLLHTEAEGGSTVLYDALVEVWHLGWNPGAFLQLEQCVGRDVLSRRSIAKMDSIARIGNVDAVSELQVGQEVEVRLSCSDLCCIEADADEVCVDLTVCELGRCSPCRKNVLRDTT